MPIAYTDLPAVVLDIIDHGEADKIITFFCQDIGKLSAIAKSAHRSKKRFVNKLELFTFLQITCSLSTGRNLAIITDADLVNSFITLRSSGPRYLAATVIRECTLLATSDNLADNRTLELILWGLNALDQGDSPRNVVALFLVSLFDRIGYRPDMASCRNCGRPYRSGSPALFSVQAGGLICSQCSKDGEYPGYLMSAGAIQVFSSIQNQSLTQLKKVKLSGKLLDEILESMHRYGRHLFQRDIHSWNAFFRRMLG